MRLLPSRSLGRRATDAPWFAVALDLTQLEMALRSQMEMIAERPTATVPGMAPQAASAFATVADQNASAEGAMKQPSCVDHAATPSPIPMRTSYELHHGRHRHFAAGLPLVRHPSRDGEKSGDNSDSECHPEDDEVKSLSLSEDGPVLRRSLSEGAGAFIRAAVAPDPVAMLTDGTRKAMLSARSVISNAAGEVAPQLVQADGARSSSGSEAPLLVVQSIEVRDAAVAAAVSVQTARLALGSSGEVIVNNSTDGEPYSSDLSMPNESDNSAAPTQDIAASTMHVMPPASDSALYDKLIPILSKVRCATAGTRAAWTTPCHPCACTMFTCARLARAYDDSGDRLDTAWRRPRPSGGRSV